MNNPKNGESLRQPTVSLPIITTENADKTTSSSQDESSETSSTTLAPTSSPTTLVSRASSLTSAISRSASPIGRLPLSSLARLSRSTTATSLNAAPEGHNDTRSQIMRAFSPTVGVLAAKDVEELVRQKGVDGGLTELIRPYGERVQGKIVVRDSAGASRAWDDFGIRLVPLTQLAKEDPGLATEVRLERLDELMEQHVDQGYYFGGEQNVPTSDEMSPYYQFFLDKLLASSTMTPHESFQHPVGAIIAISSGTPQPIETLRILYQQTASGTSAVPTFANPEYLRYYVLIHDDDRHDFAKSSALFDQMRRHFGLHCHMLRLRSAPCTLDDEDGEQLPESEWWSITEEIERLRKNMALMDLHAPSAQYIFSSDVTAIRVLLRELVAQSIVPHMEQRIALWNEQIASRRRGMTGRFMSLSKRWAGLGGAARAASALTSATASGASGNYDSLKAQYRYDTPEALLRKLADYAFMLRDFKLATSTYELLRTDYANDKAWKYLAGANEMCCAASLLNPLVNGSTKLKFDTFDQMLEMANYSYLTRCNDPFLALRALVLGYELLKTRGRTASQVASKWAIRILDLNLVGSVGHVLISERIAGMFAGRTGLGSTNWGARRRKAALWNVLCADEWMKLGRAENAAIRIDAAEELYNDTKHAEALQEYDHLSEFMQQLKLTIRMKLGQARQRGLSLAAGGSGVDQNGQQMSLPDEIEDETVEEMTLLERLDRRVNRRSMIGAGPLIEVNAPLSPTRMGRGDPLSKADDDFE